jgi:hypothetical protein
MNYIFGAMENFFSLLANRRRDRNAFVFLQGKSVQATLSKNGIGKRG